MLEGYKKIRSPDPIRIVFDALYRFDLLKRTSYPPGSIIGFKDEEIDVMSNSYYGERHRMELESSLQRLLNLFNTSVMVMCFGEAPGLMIWSLRD